MQDLELSEVEIMTNLENKKNNLYRIEITIRNKSKSELEIEWRFPKLGANQNIYFINKELILSHSEELRKGIKKLTKQFIKYYKKPNREEIQKCKSELYKIAEEGNSLYKAFFSESVESKNSLDPQMVKIHLETKISPDEHTIHIYNRSDINVPWGLIYDAEPEYEDDKNITNYLDYFGFWCLKYNITSSASEKSGLKYKKESLGSFNLIPFLNSNLYKKAKVNLYPNEQSLSELILEVNEPVYSEENFKNRLKKAVNSKTPDGMVYYYGHGNMEGIAPSSNNDDIITSTKLYHFFPQVNLLEIKETINYIYFLNACLSAPDTKERKFDFSKLLKFKEGINGLIGTFEEVPSMFAMRFGLYFLYMFLIEGKSISEICYNMRKQHWPLSLIYSFYCDPDLKIVPTQGKISQNAIILEKKNLSFSGNSLIGDEDDE